MFSHKNILFISQLFVFFPRPGPQRKKKKPYPRQIHAQFELGEQVEDDAPLVVQHPQVLLLVVLHVRHLLPGSDVLQARVLLLLSLWWLLQDTQGARWIHIQDKGTRAV